MEKDDIGDCMSETTTPIALLALPGISLNASTTLGDLSYILRTHLPSMSMSHALSTSFHSIIELSTAISITMVLLTQKGQRASLRIRILQLIIDSLRCPNGFAVQNGYAEPWLRYKSCCWV